MDETGWLKQGQHSVGVSHQYCGAVGKQANCQVSVELAVSDGRVAAPLGGRLYLPQSWTQDREGCARVGVPEEVGFRSKPELGLELIRQAREDGVPPAPVWGDCVYGDSPEFREGVRQLGMEFFLQVSGRHKAWTHPVPTEAQRVRRYVAAGAPPAQTLAEIAARFPAEQWKGCSWRAADGQTRRTRLAWCWLGVRSICSTSCGKAMMIWNECGWWWTGPRARLSLITTLWPIFISRLAGLAACD